MTTILNSVPTSPFRCEIKNPKRYTKHNQKTLQNVCQASYEGDLNTLEELLSTGDENNLFNGDLNAHLGSLTALHMAAKAGQTECVELLLQAKADPHMRECVAYGEDPEEGKTALMMAKEQGFDDTATLLEQNEKKYPYGQYVQAGPTNNAKQYDCYEFGKKPEKGWYMKRPGAARSQGLDPAKYGVAELEIEDDDDDAISNMLMAGPVTKPLPIGLLFPGQGSQYIKMMSTVKDDPTVAEYLKKSEKILGFELIQICLHGPESKLEETQCCQAAMFIAGLAGVVKLRKDREEAVERCQVMAGLSIGEYTALCAAGVFTFEDGLELVKVRSKAMDRAVKLSKQSGLSIAGLEKNKVEELCEQAKKKEGGDAVCQISNELFPKGYSVAGTDAAITALKDLADKAGALQAKILKTHGGFHTPLMQPALEDLGQKLDEMLPRMKPPRCTVYMNATGKPLKAGTNPREIVDCLKRGLTSPVLWEPSVRAMIREGVSEFYEVGPMKQIKAMMKRIDSKVWGSTSNVEV